MSYTQMMGSKRRGCIVILVDQSGSMSASFGGRSSTNRSEETARALNRCLQEIALSCQSGDVLKDRCDIGVIGYGSRVRSAFTTGALSDRGLTGIIEIANNPARVETVKRKISDGAGGLLEIESPMPIWIEPTASGGTPMAEAFGLAHEWISAWAQEHSESFPPVVINITDGMPSDRSRAAAEAKRLMQVGTKDGSLLLFNVHISGTAGAPTVTPSSAQQLPDDYAKFLFGLSSPIPDSMRGAAVEEGLEGGAGARGFIYNADIENMIKLLSFGTSPTMMRSADEYEEDYGERVAVH